MIALVRRRPNLSRSPRRQLAHPRGPERASERRRIASQSMSAGQAKESSATEAEALDRLDSEHSGETVLAPELRAVVHA